MSPEGYDVNVTIRTGPRESDVIVQKYIHVPAEGIGTTIPIVPPGMASATNFFPEIVLELYPRHFATPAEHHHHPMSDVPCENPTHHPEHRNVYAVCYVDPAGLLTATPWVNLDAANKVAQDRRGVVVALPIVADFTSGPSLFAAGSWPMAKQTEEELSDAKQGHTDEQQRRAAMAQPAASPAASVFTAPPRGGAADLVDDATDTWKTSGGFFTSPAGFTPGDQPPAHYYEYMEGTRR